MLWIVQQKNLKQSRKLLLKIYLLKKLQDSKGTTTVGELSDYVTDRVRKASVEVNGKAQTPTVRTPVALSDTWRTWQLK